MASGGRRTRGITGALTTAGIAAALAGCGATQAGHVPGTVPAGNRGAAGRQTSAQFARGVVAGRRPAITAAAASQLEGFVMRAQALARRHDGRALEALLTSFITRVDALEAADRISVPLASSLRRQALAIVAAARAELSGATPAPSQTSATLLLASTLQLGTQRGASSTAAGPSTPGSPTSPSGNSTPAKTPPLPAPTPPPGQAPHRHHPHDAGPAWGHRHRHRHGDPQPPGLQGPAHGHAGGHSGPPGGPADGSPGGPPGNPPGGPAGGDQNQGGQD